MSQAVTRVRDLSKQQVRSGLAAWLGWLFDGLDMHIYTLVATPFVAQLMHLEATDPRVGEHGAIISAGFTGLSAVSQEWWHLLIFRFLSALGIGGEWAVGASLLAETWPGLAPAPTYTNLDF